MEEDQSTTTIKQKSTNSKDLGDRVARIRAHLRKAEENRIAGRRIMVGIEEDAARQGMLELEKILTGRINAIACRYAGSSSGPNYDDFVFEMFYVLRSCVYDLSPKNSQFETRFNCCFGRRCLNVIRDVNAQNREVGIAISTESVKIQVHQAGSASYKMDIKASPGIAPDAPHYDSDGHVAELGVWDAVDNLKPPLPEVARLFFIGESYDEIALKFNVSARTVRNWLEQGCKQVEDQLRAVPTELLQGPN